jgi:hypothetical protein
MTRIPPSEIPPTPPRRSGVAIRSFPIRACAATFCTDGGLFLDGLRAALEVLNAPGTSEVFYFEPQL